ncbi:hypothetical protein ymoll0001_15340 [Yersinia mollaretii ATCC 43969]|uniref:Integrase n=1 Tax=Yersinia mollaretii (strain ATCC 43969 / DSM 18520 / CIP 103324 / CNY 7263 / WAIP 204) TaxID=349967 RepID=A0ABM9YE27_YERMW|nr:hypothetical protein ymoll0001_15340 [Yersinia mollaretii ATCC 43969]
MSGQREKSAARFVIKGLPTTFRIKIELKAKNLNKLHKL